MEIIPDYDTKFQSIEAPAPVPVQRATQVTVEGGISFGQYNANNPGLDAMYNMVGNLLKTGSDLYEGMTNLGFKKAAFEAETRNEELKRQLEEQYTRNENAFDLLMDSFGDPFQLGSGGYTGRLSDLGGRR